MPHELPKAYDPTAIEDRWAEYWVRERLFDQPSPAPGAASSEGEPFTILLPPPNVTGNLHMGHMFEHAESDILVRWRRMCGDPALWVPGTDHAGIATQMLVERQITSEGTSRQQLGREAFVNRVWQWKQHYGGVILQQMKRLGASVDWSREYFTMDEKLSVAVKEAFVRLHEQGLIYRGAYIVNWCPGCQTAISDLEVIHEEQQGKLWEIRYPVVENPGEYLTIATTRPETMLGDVAVAVHPEDARYLHLHGKRLRLPLLNRDIPVITDAWVSPEFGTGAVKVTPAHDPNDFALGQRHGLPSINVMDETAHINSAGGAYAGIDRYEARRRILADLESQGFLVAAKEHTNSVGKCDRSKDIVEPRLSTQWFLKIQPLADKAIAAVEQGYIKIGPDQYRKTYLEWMRNIHDWCISRQLWWGHRIPAWHCAACKQTTVARDTPSACGHCGSAEIDQETDVLDTWFSSGLLPFTVFGWPKHTLDLDAFYPTSLLVTGFDILFFWVARMIMLGCHFMLDVPLPNGSERTLQDAVPFREVYIHALVRDAGRQKMSKTKGNVIDPIEIVKRFGTDAVRFTLASMASPGTDIAFSEARTEGYRAFANKIWNAARFIFMNMDRAERVGLHIKVGQITRLAHNLNEWPVEERWILSRFNRLANNVNFDLTNFRFDDAANILYHFFWDEFCDWYLEIVKLRINFDSEAAKDETSQALATLLFVFERFLRLLSPVMPFITEELWHALFQGSPPIRSISLAGFPQHQERNQLEATIYAAAELSIDNIQDVVIALRSCRKDLGINDRMRISATLATSSSKTPNLQMNQDILKALAGLDELKIVATSDRDRGGTYKNLNWKFYGGLAIFIDHEKQIDVVAERERLLKKLEQYTKGVANADRQLNNEAFLAKAPEQIIAGLKKQRSQMTVLLNETREALGGLGSQG